VRSNATRCWSPSTALTRPYDSTTWRSTAAAWQSPTAAAGLQIPSLIVVAVKDSHVRIDRSRRMHPRSLYPGRGGKRKALPNPWSKRQGLQRPARHVRGGGTKITSAPADKADPPGSGTEHACACERRIRILRMTHGTHTTVTEWRRWENPSGWRPGPASQRRGWLARGKADLGHAEESNCGPKCWSAAQVGFLSLFFYFLFSFLVFFLFLTILNLNLNFEYEFHHWVKYTNSSF
jgi:hypothetical protein